MRYLYLCTYLPFDFLFVNLILFIYYCFCLVHCCAQIINKCVWLIGLPAGLSDLHLYYNLCTPDVNYKVFSFNHLAPSYNSICGLNLKSKAKNQRKFPFKLVLAAGKANEKRNTKHEKQERETNLIKKVYKEMFCKQFHQECSPARLYSNLTNRFQYLYAFISYSYEKKEQS